MAAGSSEWRVELSRDAERSVRSAPPVSRRAIATVLDRLAHEGLPPDAVPLDDAGAWLISEAVGDVVVACRPDERLILVVGITTVSEAPVRDTLRFAHLPARMASGIAEFLLELGGDVRFAVRSFSKRPGLALSILITLTLAIGGTTALFGPLDRT